MNYRKEPISAAAFGALSAEKREQLKPFSTYTAPHGDQFGDPDRCVVFTEWGIEGDPVPLIGQETTWDCCPDSRPGERRNEQHEYWLCVPVEEDG